MEDVRTLLEEPLQITRRPRPGESDTYRLSTVYHYADRYGRFRGSMTYAALCDRTVITALGPTYRERCDWHDIRVTRQAEGEAPEPFWLLLDANRFTYEYVGSVDTPTVAFSQVDFTGIPQDVRHYPLVVMVMDLHSLDLELTMAQMLNLHVGERQRASFAEVPSSIAFGKAVRGTFTNGPTHVAYLGVTRHQGVTCGLIEGSSVNNAMELEMDDAMGHRIQKGTSSYRVKVAASLEDGRIMAGSLCEALPLVETSLTVPGGFGPLETSYVVWRELDLKRVAVDREPAAALAYAGSTSNGRTMSVSTGSMPNMRSRTTI